MHRRDCCVDCADPASCQAMDDCVIELAKLLDTTTVELDPKEDIADES